MTRARRVQKHEAARAPATRPFAEAAVDIPPELEAAYGELRAAESTLARQAAELDEVRAALRKERARYGALFDLAPTALLITDLNGIIRGANDAAAALLGTSDALLTGRPLGAFAAGTCDSPSWPGSLSAEPGVVQTSELRLAPRDRPPFRAEVRVRKVRRPEADEDELVWSLQDVESRAAAEEELRLLAAERAARVGERTGELEQERARLAAVLEQAPAGIVVAEAPSGRIVLVNEQVARILRTDVRADRIEDYAAYRGFRRDGRPYRPEEWPLARSVQAGEVVTGELVSMVRGDETQAFIELSSTPIRRSDGSVTGAIVILTDVTERESRERSEREFVTNAAHELQTPLAAILSAAEVLDAGAKEEPADRDRFIGHILRECARLARLVQALLILARAQTRAEEPVAEAIELQPLLDEMALSLHPASGVEVRVDCAPDVAALANRQLLEHAIGNLGANAAKYTPAGTIWLAARPFGEGEVAIEVSDTGVGVVPGEEERLFERFYRSGDRDRSGFGLGLAMVRQTVEALGGSVELRRRREGGTAVTMTIPRAPAQENDG